MQNIICIKKPIEDMDKTKLAIKHADYEISIKTKKMIIKYLNDMMSSSYDYKNEADIDKLKIYFLKILMEPFLRWNNRDNKWKSIKNINKFNEQPDKFNKILSRHNIKFYKGIYFINLSRDIIFKDIEKEKIIELIDFIRSLKKNYEY